MNLRCLPDDVLALKFAKARCFASDSMYRFGLGIGFAMPLNLPDAVLVHRLELFDSAPAVGRMLVRVGLENQRLLFGRALVLLKMLARVGLENQRWLFGNAAALVKMLVRVGLVGLATFCVCAGRSLLEAFELRGPDAHAE